MIHFSKSAKKEIFRVFENEKIATSYSVRLGMAGSSCAAKYIFGLDKKSSNDEEFEIEGIRVIIDKKHLMHLIGKRVDYKSENGESFFGIE